MFKSIKPFPVEGFQKINITMNDDGFFDILKPDDGDFYHLKHVIATTYVDDIDAINCIRSIYELLPSMILPLYGFRDEIYYGMLLHGDRDEALSAIYDVQFHYTDLNNYAREAQLIYYSRKKGFQCPEEVRHYLSLIGMAYVELARGAQFEFMLPTEEDIAWKEYAASEYHTSEFIATGLCRMVWDWRREGKTEREIAELLYDNGKWCSLAQIGALLHNNDTRISADSMKKYASRLLAKPKE